MKKVVIAFTAVVAMAVMILGKASKDAVTDKLFLDNVEALAAGENGGETCLGHGCVDCSSGDKVEYVLIPFNL